MTADFRLAAARVHFIGIGGIGMCGLAELLHNMGAQVTGSDANENLQTQRLESLGIRLFKGHHAENLGDSEVVVFSSAVKPDNVEYQEARRRRIPLIRRAEALAEIMRLKRGIAIAGTHGKTTTTSLAASIFLAAEMDPTIVVGGRLEVIKSTAQLGKGDWLVAEADESDGSFSRLSPEIVIITNIDNDHLDHYGDFKTLQAAFFDFALRIPFYGALIVCGDDPVTRELFRDFPKKVLFYGFKDGNTATLVPDQDGGGGYRVVEAGVDLVRFSIPLPGRHNALNACAALLAAREAGVDMAQAAGGVAGFRGVDRRFQHKASIRGIEFYDDYGHHPTEVEAVLSGFREKFPGRRLVVVFQPHRYSRTQICWQQFCKCFTTADRVFLLDVYAAGEAPIAGVTGERLAADIKHAACTYVSRQKDPVLGAVLDDLKPGDVVLTLGAGDVVRLGERLMENLAKS
jgi:UDP-N-acetylmuramate--alanine ligase